MTLGDRIVVLADGRMQQVGTPIELYRAPANRFVAGFIGTPPMNFVDGRLEHADDAARFVADGLRVPVGRARAALSPQPATLGIRPEALRLAPEPGDDAPSGRVVLVERLGGTSHVHVAVGPHR